MLELDAQGDLAAGELVGEHRHRPAEHVGPGCAVRDPVEPGAGAGGVDVADESVKHLVTSRDLVGFTDHRREQPVVPLGQLLGDDDRFGNRGGDPPVFDQEVRVVFALSGLDGGSAEVFDDGAWRDLVDF